MSELATAPAAASLEEIQQGWHELRLRVGQLEAEKSVLEQENKALRMLLERVIEHRQKSHSELVFILTNLAAKLPLSDIGGIVAKLVEHNTNATQFLSGLIKGASEAHLPAPELLKTLEQSKRDLAAAIKQHVEELVQLDPPLEHSMLHGLVEAPEQFFAPRNVRAIRCYLKGQVPRERVLREFGEQALIFFNDVTTDPKLNPRPKPDEIALAFKPEFETLFEQNPGLLPDKRQQLHDLHQKVQRSKAATEQARLQRNTFQRLSFLIDLLYYYQGKNTEAIDVIFAQRLPALIEQLVLSGPQDGLDEKLITQAESLMVYVINPDHRLMIINNVGKGGESGKTLKYVLRLRGERTPDLHHLIAEFIRHLIPASPQKPPAPATLAAIFRLLPVELQRTICKAIMQSDRLRKEDAQALGQAIGTALGLTGLVEEAKAEAEISPELERQQAWMRIKDLMHRRGDPGTVATAIRDRLHAKYDAEEIRQSWMTLIDAEPIAFIRIFCQIPYLANGTTDAIARTVMETYVHRLTHEKYQGTYNKVVTSLRNMFAAKPDSPTLLNFMALVRWVGPEAAMKLTADIGMPA